jgi:hypothetical protein
MRVLLLAAILYLLSVVAILYVKPALMFREDGTWKEFGLHESDQHTPFPFWMFCLLSALLSYGVSRFLISSATGEGTLVAAAQETIPTPLQLPKRANTIVETLKPGYYVLNREGSAAEGVPRYIYIGEAPLENSSER